jgi:isopentenyl diphosphate isomerase/L-lactate dehydrogenase-like FMN-dependent dehydrogenase
MHFRDAQNIDDLRAIARSRLPRIAWDFLDGGTEDNLSLDNNRDVFKRIRFRPHTLIDVSKRSAKTTVFGKTFNAPFGIAPTGAAGLYGFKADSAMARAARDAGLPFILSTASFEPLEEVAAAGAGGTLWFQLYMAKARAPVEKLVTRALNAGFEALVLTSDVAAMGNREYNRRNGFSTPLKMNLRNLIDGALHPRWTADVFLRTLLDSGVPRYQNVSRDGNERITASPVAEFQERREEVNWEDFRWLREFWPKKLFIKGVVRGDDALKAQQLGADGVFISNHGGRQLDGIISPLEAIPEIRAATGKDFKVMADGGFRRGADVIKAVALGADMAFLGRPLLYGISAGGEAGALHALKILRSEIDRVLALTGICAIDELTPDLLWHPEFVPVPASR